MRLLEMERDMATHNWINPHNGWVMQQWHERTERGLATFPSGSDPYWMANAALVAEGEKQVPGHRWDRPEQVIPMHLAYMW